MEVSTRPFVVSRKRSSGPNILASLTAGAVLQAVRKPVLYIEVEPELEMKGFAVAGGSSSSSYDVLPALVSSASETDIISYTNRTVVPQRHAIFKPNAVVVSEEFGLNEWLPMATRMSSTADTMEKGVAGEAQNRCVDGSWLAKDYISGNKESKAWLKSSVLSLERSSTD